MFFALKSKTFRIYWCGMFISLIGTWIQSVAQSWLVFQLTNSAFLLGITGFLGFIPVFILSLFGGVAADRINKRNILIFTQSAFMVLAFLLAVLTQGKLIRVWQIMLIAVFNGIIMAFDAPARQAVVAEMVERKYLFNAIALNSVAFNSSRIIGPALAGIFVATIGMAGCFYINGLSFLALIVALLLIKIKPLFKSDKDNSVVRDLKEGLKEIRNNRIIMVLVSMVGMVGLFGISYNILMPIFAQDILKVGVKGLGVLMSSSGVGALIAALLLARLGDFKYKGKYLAISCIIFSLSLVLFSLSRIYLLSLASLALVGGFSVSAIALLNTLLQTAASDEFRGRLMSVFMFTFAGLLPLGNLLAGVLAQAIGVSLTVCLSGIVCAIFFMIINVLYPQLREI